MQNKSMRYIEKSMYIFLSVVIGFSFFILLSCPAPTSKNKSKNKSQRIERNNRQNKNPQSEKINSIKKDKEEKINSIKKDKEEINPIKKDKEEKISEVTSTEDSKVKTVEIPEPAIDVTPDIILLPEEPIKPLDGTTLSFSIGEVTKVFRSSQKSHTQEVSKEEVAEDKGKITYRSDDESIAIVDADSGEVSFVKTGEVTITAIKAGTADMYKPSTAQYKLIIAQYKPANKNELIVEIKKAMAESGNDVNLNYIDTNAITDMDYLFSKDVPSSSGKKKGYNLQAFYGDISGWDVSNVTTMRSMFYGATEFNGDLSAWKEKVSKVTNMMGMFRNARSFTGIGLESWTVSSVKHMQFMFHNAIKFNQDVSNWNIEKVVRMENMFHSAKAFTYQLEDWGKKLNKSVNVQDIFKNSGVVKLSSWCKRRNCR